MELDLRQEVLDAHSWCRSRVLEAWRRSLRARSLEEVLGLGASGCLSLRVAAAGRLPAPRVGMVRSSKAGANPSPPVADYPVAAR
jgi:hypothetical protein